MATPHNLKDVIAALDPIADWWPQGLRELSRRLRWEVGWQGAGPLSYRALKRTVGGDSLRQTLHAIDSNNPPRSLRQAYERLGFPVGGGVTRLPNGPISLRKIIRRIKAPETVALRFLSYNTYLLPGLQIPFGRWVDDAIGWDALSWFGIPFGGALLATLGLVSIPGVALAIILKQAGFTPSKVIKRVTGIDLNGISIKAKPARDERATELGAVLAAYDVCCLSEVFTNDSRERIMAGLRGAQWRATTGPDESGAWILASSGLFFLVKSRGITHTEQMIFANRGERLRDSDAWSNKGVLLNVIDVGIGQLELFQTHLFYGGGIPLGAEPSEDDRVAVWRNELAQVADFYRRHHQPQNVALITGDFNMSAADVRHYAELRRTMDGLNLHDLWAWDVYSHNPSEGHTCRFTDGDEAGWWRDFRPVCAPPEAGQPPQYCDDYRFHPAPPRGVGRYDYIFAERPTAAHRYNLEVSRLLRRPFPRRQTTGGEGYLSDHLGLDLTMYLSPR
jgi:hypothetical protein